MPVIPVAKPKKKEDVLTDDEAKLVESIARFGNNINVSLYQFMEWTSLSKAVCKQCVDSLVELGVLGCITTGRGQICYCKCGDLLTPSK